MSKKTSLKLIFLFSFLTFAFSFANAQDLQIDYKEYNVIKGDTLWDISSKEFEEQDPFLWPKIWKDNVFIKNPDLIYPGQKIKIPLRLLKKELLEEVKKEAPVEAEVKKEEAVTEKVEEAVTEKEAEVKEETKVIVEAKRVELDELELERKIKPITLGYLADADLIISSGYITDYISKEIKSLGKIIASPSGRTLFGTHDYVYVKTNSPANAGDKFYIIRSIGRVRHPKTNDKLGHLIAIIGVAEIVGTEDNKTKALITKSYNETNTGDLLDTYYEVEPIFAEDSPRKPEISGIIVAARHLRIINGSYDIIFIDKGSNQGLELGDMFKTISFDKNAKSRTTGSAHIISLKETTAAALVKQSESAVSAGDIITTLEE